MKKYRVDECFKWVSYGKETSSAKDEFATLEGYPVYESSDGWNTGAEAKFFDTLKEAVAYCEEKVEDTLLLKFGEEKELLDYSIVELDEEGNDVDTVDTYYQDYAALSNYVVVIQDCKIIGTEEARGFETEIGECAVSFNVYENSVDKKIKSANFFATLDDAQDFCENNRGHIDISLEKEVICSKYSIYSVCDEVAKAKKIESEGDLGYLEEVIYPEFEECD